MGRPFFSEVVFSHRPSRTLFVTDLWWNYPTTTISTGDAVPTSTRLWKFGMDAIYRPFYNAFMQGAQTTFDSRLSTILSWDWDSIVPAHGEPITGPDAKATLLSHLSRDAAIQV